MRCEIIRRVVLNVDAKGLDVNRVTILDAVSKALAAEGVTPGTPATDGSLTVVVDRAARHWMDVYALRAGQDGKPFPLAGEGRRADRMYGVLIRMLDEWEALDDAFQA